MFEAMDRGELRTLYVIGENPADSESDRKHAMELLRGLDFLVVQDIVLTRTAKLADVVLPGSASWAEADGTVTNSERRVQLCRKALDPPGEARDDIWIIAELARRLGFDWGEPTAEQAWDELRSLSPMHRGMRYDRLAEHGGLQWPCPSEDHPGSQFLHDRLWKDPVEGPLAPFSVTPFEPPVDELDDDFPIRLTTGRRLESYNTGAQTNLYRSPLHRGESLDLSPEDAERLGIENGEVVLVSSRRGAVRAPARIDRILRPGPGVHDVPLPGPGRHQRPDDRSHRPEVGHVGVQGDRDPGREAAGRGAERVEAGVPAPCRERRRRRTAANGDQVAAGTAIAWRRGTATASLPGSAPDGPAAAARCADRRRASRGGPVPGWHDGVAERPRPRGDVQGRSMHGGHEARDRRHLLLPVLEAVQARIGWISEGALGYICERLTVPPADAYGVATFYGLLSMNPRPARVLHVCDDVVCRCKGAEDLIAALEERIGPEDVDCGGCAWLRSPCLGQCDRGAGGDADGGGRASDRARARGG